MVSLDLLSSLDGLIWLQSGAKVGALFQQHQTTVSRNQKRCAQVFGITIIKSENKWNSLGDSTLLQLERTVHQTARLKGKSRLRLEVNGLLDIHHFNKVPFGWIVESSSNLPIEYILQYIRQSIIDVSLCSLIDPPTDLQGLSIIPLKITRDDGFMVQVGIVLLQKHANEKRILDLINMLEQA